MKSAKRNQNAGTPNKFLLKENSPFLMQEDYKTLRTNVLFSFPDGSAKVIVITSANRGEGKSTNAVNLAVSYAQLGKNVLLVDCDLRLPTIAAKLHVAGGSEMPGLSNLLVENLPLGDVIRHHYTGIYVLCAGTLPPDPTRLLQSARMEALLSALKSQFDCIILDCPPVNTVVDAALLAPSADGYLLVVRHGSTEFRDAAEMLDQLRRVNARILGFVYTNAPPEDHKKYYKHGYGDYGKRQ